MGLKDTTGEVMAPDPCTAGPACSAIEALRLVWDGGFRHAPVVAQSRVVRVVSSGDFRDPERDRLDTETSYWERI